MHIARTSEQVKATLAGEGDSWFEPWRFCGLIAVLLALCFARVVVGLETFVYADFGQFAYPAASYARDCFWRGELPLWNPLNNCGTPFLAQWNTQTLYPLSLFYFLLPMPWSFNIFCVLHLLLAAMGMYHLAYSWTGNRLAGAVAGSVFAFNGVTWYGLMWPHLICALAWMPWVVLTMEQSWRKGGRFVLIAALVGAMQLLSGGAEVIFLTWLMLGLWWGVFFVRREVSRGTLAMRALVAGCLAFGLGAVQLLPFLELLLHSQRQAGFGSAYGNRGSIPLSGWANYLLPLFQCFRNPRGQFVQPDRLIASYYMGIGTLALGMLAVWRVRNWRVRLLAAFAAFGVVMAMGDRTIVFSALKQALPIFALMRFPSKFVMLTSFVTPLLAAFALASLRGLPIQAQKRAQNQLFVVAAAMIIVISVLLWFAWKYPIPRADVIATVENAGVRVIFLGLVLACVTLLYGPAARGRQQLFQIGLVVVLWGDVFTHNTNLSPTLPTSVLAPGLVRQSLGWGSEFSAGSRRIMESPASYRRLLLLSLQDLLLDTSARRFAQYFDFNLLDDIPKFDGFYSLDLKEYSDLFGNFYYSTNDSQALKDFLGISHINSATNVAEWEPRNSFLPMVTTGQRPVFATSEDTLEGLFGRGFDPRQVAYLPFEAQSPLTASAQSKSRIVSSHFSAHKLQIEVEADAPALVVVAQAFYHSWHAYMDGKPCQLWRANYAFQALAVPAGKHYVELVYQDKALVYGAVISALSLLLSACLWFLAPGLGRGTGGLLVPKSLLAAVSSTAAQCSATGTQPHDRPSLSWLWKSRDS
jgi:hypothetical protein